MDKFRVHRLNFFEPEAKAIQSLAYDEDTKCLAVCRSDSTIEIWNLNYKFYMEKVILGQPLNSIECVVWCKGRLFSAGLHGKIIEYDLNLLKPKSITAVTVGCCIWCLSLNKEKTFLAAGTEDGHVSIYSLSSSGIDFEKILSKQEGRILSLAWHESGKILVTGSIDTIRLYNVESGKITDRILVSRIEKHSETIIWCLAITRDMIIISGDSCGRTSFWDAKTGTLLSASVTHKADVLSLCLSQDEKTVYTSGVDPVIIMHVRSGIGQKQIWMKSVQRNIHTHDVRALVLTDTYLVSGGVDKNLVFSKFPPKTVISFCPFSYTSYCAIAEKKSCVLLKYPKHLELWKLGETNENSGTDGEQLLLKSHPVKLINLKCRADDTIICSDISSDAKWIAYSTLYDIKLFRISLGEISPTIQRVKTLPFKEVEPARCLLFTSDGRHLLIITSDGLLQYLKCDVSYPEYLATFYPSDFKLNGRIHLINRSSNDQYVALGSQDGNVSIYNLNTGRVHCLLPKYKCQATAMEFDLKCQNIIVAYSDRMIIEFDLENKIYSHWSKQRDLTEFQNFSYFPIRGITFIPNDNFFIVHDEAAIYKFSKSSEDDMKVKRTKISNNVTEHNSTRVTGLNYSVVSKYKHLLEFKAIHEDEMLVLEVKPSQIQGKLPPALQRKKYGT